ncbi:hypothetical protein FKW31_03055 [Acetobacter sp. DmW_136]|nr:hypothetical protein FKW31_03055 [Acetobacter sp. DmW_136]
MAAWTSADVKILERMANAGDSWEKISRTLNRTPGACQYKACASLVISEAARKKRWEDSRKKQGEKLRGRAHRWKEKKADKANAKGNTDSRTRPCIRCGIVFTTPHKCRFLCIKCNSYASSLGW